MKNKKRTNVLMRLTIFGEFDIIIKKVKNKADYKKKGSGSMVTASNVANNILQRAFAEDIDITPMKLQKLIYCVYKDYLKRTGKALFEEEFQTWKYGPVLPSVYQEFKERGANRINNFAGVDRKGTYTTVAEDNNVFKKAVDKIWNTYKSYDGVVLSSYTHGENTAWRKALKERRNYLLDSEIKEEEDYVEL